MKRFALVALLAATLFGVSSASATELKVKGSFEAAGEWSANLYDFNADEGDADNQYIGQRMRTYFTFQTNEDLKAVLGLEMDNIWGGGDSDWGTDVNEGGAIEIKHAYLDFTFPDTVINVKAGLQYVALPSVFGNPVFDEDAPAIVVSAPINDMVALTAGFTRGNDDAAMNTGYAENGDELDAAFLVAPITLDGFEIAPYFAYAWVGATSSGTSADTVVLDNTFNGFGEDASIWVVGANAALTMYDPFKLEADLIYGGLDTDADVKGGGDDYKSYGWYGALAASYKFDMVTPILFTTYASGASDDDDSDDILPVLADGWGITPFIGGGRAFSFADDSYLTATAPGVWAVGLKLTDMSFVENLSHELTVAYAMGTSDEFKDTGVEFDEESSAWEVYLVNKYMIFENLAAVNELGFCDTDIDSTQTEDTAYFGTVGFQYKF